MKYRVAAGLAALVLGASAFATETTTYEYDERGRLIKSVKSGGPASGTEKCTSFDPAGNRTNQTVDAAGCTPVSGGGSNGGGGSGGGSNNPPVAYPDYIVVNCGPGSVNVIKNDEDPDDDPVGTDPRTAISVTGGMGAYIVGGTYVHITSATTGTLNYTIEDTNGATASSTIAVIDLCGGP